MSREILLKDITKSIDDCNAICYPSYRTAAKFQILHKALNMHCVDLKLIIEIFERHRLSVTENSVTLDDTEIEDVINDIYFAAQKDNKADFDVNKTTKLTVNYILNTFDNKHRGKALVFSVKVFLTLLCCGKLQDKYEYLYKLLADHNACLSKASLYMLLSNICNITETIGENVAYGSHYIQSSIENCFIESQGCLGVSEAEFSIWLMQDPQLFSWISTFNRLKLAEKIIHNVKCSTCKTTPIHGPRFSCVRCTKYHQCQACFFHGKISNKHKLKHPVREYCNKTTNREVKKIIVELIRNKLRICPTHVDTLRAESLLPNPTEDEARQTDALSLRGTIKRKILSDPQKELQSIINHLEDENRQLQVEIQEICGSRSDRLQRHRTTVESQLQRLKILKKYLFNGQQIALAQTVNRVQSTPMLRPIAAKYPNFALPEFELSPIGRQVNTNKTNIQSRGDPCNMTKDKLKSCTNTYVNSIDNNDDDNDDEDDDDDQQYSKNLYSYPQTSESTKIELSTWIGENKTSLEKAESGFSQWLDANNGLPKDLPSSLQRFDKHSQHSSLQNIQGDLNEILSRLQHMVANDCLLEESFTANDNCELKRAATEMEDLLTGLIEGMESRIDKLATVV